MCTEIDNEILDKIELEINHYHTNIHYDRSRIINLFILGHDNLIQRTQINSNEHVVQDERNDYINDIYVTKIKLTPKNILQSRIKSAKN